MVYNTQRSFSTFTIQYQKGGLRPLARIMDMRRGPHFTRRDIIEALNSAMSRDFSGRKDLFMTTTTSQILGDGGTAKVAAMKSFVVFIPRNRFVVNRSKKKDETVKISFIDPNFAEYFLCNNKEGQPFVKALFL